MPLDFTDRNVHCNCFTTWHIHTHTIPAEYGQIVKMLGSGHMEVQCFDGTKRIAHIRGKMRKKVLCPRALPISHSLSGDV